MCSGNRLTELGELPGGADFTERIRSQLSVGCSDRATRRGPMLKKGDADWETIFGKPGCVVPTGEFSPGCRRADARRVIERELAETRTIPPFI
jgi:hypothetical protein